MKISKLQNYSSPTPQDILPIIDIDGGSEGQPTTKRVTVQNLLDLVQVPLSSNNFEIPTTIKTTAESSDYFIGIDSAGVLYKITKANLLAGLSTGGSIGGSTPDYSANVSLLLSHNGTSFVDASSNTFTLVNSGATISSDEITFSGGTTLISSVDNAKFSLGSGDFTIEAWLKPTLDTNDRYWISQCNDLSDNSNRQFAVGASTSGFKFYWTTNGRTDQLISFPCAVTSGTWQHIAVSRSGNTLYGFLNGSLVTSTSFTSTLFDSSADFIIGGFGRYGSNFPELSYIGKIRKSGLRLTQGIGRYTANFTPQSSF